MMPLILPNNLEFEYHFFLSSMLENNVLLIQMGISKWLGKNTEAHIQRPFDKSRKFQMSPGQASTYGM
jgi:hypothetical protein